MTFRSRVYGWGALCFPHPKLHTDPAFIASGVLSMVPRDASRGRLTRNAFTRDALR